MEWLLSFFFLGFGLCYYALLRSLKSKARTLSPPLKKEPFVSILVPVRNEAAHIERLLMGLTQQTYRNYEILIGDDNSEDTTGKLVQQWQQRYPKKIRYFLIKGNPYAKQGVLSYLTRQAQGAYYLITDADVIVPPTWLTCLIRRLQTCHLVTHPTFIRHHDFFSALQYEEWLDGFVWSIGMEGLKLPITAIGNNLGVEAKAYWKTGGYSALPFSIVEDYLLYQTFLHHGFCVQWFLDRRALAWTEAMPDWKSLLEQRLRWSKGGMKGVKYIHGMVIINALWLPALLLTLFFGFWKAFALALWSWGLKLRTLRWLEAYFRAPSTSWWVLLCYPFYLGLLAVILGFYFTFAKVKWKGRTYDL